MTNASYRLVHRYLNQLFDACFEELWASGGRPRRPLPPQPPIDFRVRKSLRILDDGLAQGIELDAVARDAGLVAAAFLQAVS